MSPTRILNLIAIAAVSLCSSPIAGQQTVSPPEAPSAETTAKIPILGESGQAKLEKGDVRGAIADFKQAFELSRELIRADPNQAAYSENAYYYLGRLAAAFATAGEMANALQMQDPGARGYEELAVSDPNPGNKQKASSAIGDLAWYQLLNRKPAEALANARKALELDPAQTGNKTTQAHALLLTGQEAEAKTLYQAERSMVLPSGMKFEQAVLEELAALEKHGTQAPQFNEIRKLYGFPIATGPGDKVTRSSGVLTWVIVAGIFLFIGAVFGVFIYAENKRVEKLEAIVSRLGLSFRRKATDTDSNLLANARLANRGRRRTIANVIEPQSGGERFIAFDFSYTEGTGKRATTYTQTVIRLDLPGMTLPSFEATPENFLTKLAQGVGFRDIEMDGRSAFNRLFRLKGQDEEAIREVFTPLILNYLEQPQSRNLCLEGAGDRLLVYRLNRRPKPEELEAFLEEGKTLLNLFKQVHRTATSVPPPVV